MTGMDDGGESQPLLGQSYGGAKPGKAKKLCNLKIKLYVCVFGYICITHSAF